MEHLAFSRSLHQFIRKEWISQEASAPARPLRRRSSSIENAQKANVTQEEDLLLFRNKV